MSAESGKSTAVRPHLKLASPAQPYRSHRHWTRRHRQQAKLAMAASAVAFRQRSRNVVTLSRYRAPKQ